MDWRLTLEFAHLHVLQVILNSEKDGGSVPEKCFVTGGMRLSKILTPSPNIGRLQKESHDG